MRKILRIALLFASFFICARSMAQTGGTVVKGTVADEKGITLPGVTVTVKDAKVNAITDINGNYTITVPTGGRILTFSFIGMQPQEAAIETRTQINITLKSSTTSLNRCKCGSYRIRQPAQAGYQRCHFILKGI
jgi:hypothetical protein